MTKAESDANNENIWSIFTVEQLAVAIASLGSRINELKDETWRLNDVTKLSTSLWYEIIEKLKVNHPKKAKINHTEQLRHSLYNVWKLKRHDIRPLLNNKLKPQDRIININGEEPLPEHPKTRFHKEAKDNDNLVDGSDVTETSFVLTASEWKAAFNETDMSASPLFRLRIFGEENHDPAVVIMSRQLKGKERLRVGKRANEIGPLAVFHERLEAADEKLLEAGNFTECETIEIHKKAALDYRVEFAIDEYRVGKGVGDNKQRNPHPHPSSP
ncbi:hypothetical protein I4U23_027480 [Adineta vaga]|nr:hypothetical protein I4U23_027480 [Adineta vaga]